jgi:hypothetical protein
MVHHTKRQKEGINCQERAPNPKKRKSECQGIQKDEDGIESSEGDQKGPDARATGRSDTDGARRAGP